jgi:hypothetical protein
MNSQNDNENLNGEPENGKPETANVTTNNIPALRASTAVASLTAMLNSVHAVPSGVRSAKPAKPSMFFKARKGGGVWLYGRAQTIVEDGSHWAINPATLEHGYVALNGKVWLGEEMVPVDQPKPDVTELPQVGVPYQEQRSVNMRCLTGIDAGAEVTFKTTSVGGFQAIDDLIAALRDRLSSGLHDNKLSPIVTLGKSDYTHPEYGPQCNPVLKIGDWMPLEGPPPTPAPAPQPTPPSPASPSSPSSSASTANEQPRRRRVA